VQAFESEPAGDMYTDADPAGGGEVEQALAAAESCTRGDVFPEPSYASTASAYVVPHCRPEKPYVRDGVVPFTAPFRYRR
jgi:hypothetical protein